MHFVTDGFTGSLEAMVMAIIGEECDAMARRRGRGCEESNFSYFLYSLWIMVALLVVG